MIRMIWKRKWLVLGVWVLLSLLTVAGVRSFPKSYRAEVVVLVDSQKIPEHYVPSAGNTEVQDRLATISQQILSFNRLHKVISDLSLYPRERGSLTPEDLVEKMRGDIKLKIERGWTSNRPGAFRIAYAGEDPDTAAQVANRLGVLFADENVHTREVQAAGTEEFINAQLAEAKKTLDRLDAQVSQYKLSHNGELPEQQESLINTMAQLRSTQDSIRDNLSRAQDAKMNLENTLSTTEISLHALERSIAERAQAERAQMAASPLPSRQKKPSEVLQDRYTALLVRYSPNHPDAMSLKRAIDVALAEERSGPPEPVAKPAPSKTDPALAVSSAAELEQTRQRVRMLKSQIAQTEKDFDTHKAELARIGGEIAARQVQLGRLPLREQEMAQLLRDYETSKGNYGKLLDQKLAAEMTTDMERRQKSERFTILDPARPPTRPVGPSRMLFYAGGSLLGLALSAGLILLLESRKAVFLGEWELPEGVMVLGRLPVVEIKSSQP